MNKKQNLILMLFALSLVFITSCSKDDQSNLKKQDKVASYNNDALMAKLAELGIDVSKSLNSRLKSSDPYNLELYQNSKLEYQDVWYQTACKFDTTICAPSGYHLKTTYYIYYYDENVLVEAKKSSNYCITAGKSINLTGFYVSGNYHDIAVLAIVYIKENKIDGKSTLYGWYPSNRKDRAGIVSSSQLMIDLQNAN